MTTTRQGTTASPAADISVPPVPSTLPGAAVGTGIVCVALGISLAIAAHLNGSKWPTAAIPAYVGVLFVLLGALATTPTRRKHLMHVAAALALLLGLAGLGMALPKMLRYYGGNWPADAVARPLAWWGQVGLSAIMLVFLALAVRSFIAAKRWREGRAADERGSTRMG